MSQKFLSGLSKACCLIDTQTLAGLLFGNDFLTTTIRWSWVLSNCKKILKRLCKKWYYVSNGYPRTSSISFCLDTRTLFYLFERNKYAIRHTSNECDTSTKIFFQQLDTAIHFGLVLCTT